LSSELGTALRLPQTWSLKRLLDLNLALGSPNPVESFGHSFYVQYLEFELALPKST
jgi:hypothetical protein